MIFVLLLRWYIIVQKILEPAGSKTFKNANFTPKFQKIPNVLEPANSKPIGPEMNDHYHNSHHCCQQRV